MQIFRGSENELKQQFGLSAMTVVWVGLLRSKNILLTEPVLELCKAGAPLASLFNDRSLLLAIDDPEKLGALQRKYDPELQTLLVVLDQGSYRVLALEAEVMAESGWKSQAQALGVQNDTALTTIESHLQGLENLFSPQDIARLKMVIATAVNPEEKIEAIRKMAMAKLSFHEKGILFLHALADTQLEVRREAAHALRNIGFNPEIAETIISLSGGDEMQHRHAISSLGQIFARADDLEKGTVLQVLLTTLRDKNYRDCNVLIVNVLSKIVSQIITQSPAMLERIMASVVEVLVSHLDELLDPATTLFQAITDRNATLAGSFLWSEIQKTDSRRLRAFLLFLMVETGVPFADRQQLANKIAYEIGLGDELDPVYLRLTGAIVQLQDSSVQAVLTRFHNSIRTTERMQAIQIIDKIFSEPTASSMMKNIIQIKNEVVKAYIDAFPTAINPLRLAILDSRLLQDPTVSGRLQTEFAGEALVDIHKERLDQFHEGVKAALFRMGQPAISALLKILRNPLQPQQAVRAAEILGEVIGNLKADARQEAIKIKDFCIKQIKNRPPHQGELFKILGRLAASKCSDTQMADDITEYLLLNVCKTVYPYRVLEGMGWAASGDWTSADLKTDVCHLLRALMDKRLPENISRVTQVGQNKIFELDVKIAAYSDLLPVLVTAMWRLAMADATSNALRKSILDYLRRKWQQLVEYKIIWGPKSTMDLAETLHDLCLHSEVALDDKIALAEALYYKIDIFTITELLASIFEKQSVGRLPEIAEKTGNKLLEFAHSDEYKSAEDREIVMRCIGRMVAAEKLATGHNASEHMREKLLYILFDGLREQIFGITNILQNLLASPHLSKRMQKEIQRRLPQLALVKGATDGTTNGQ